jgi:hypothetical protein
VSGPTLLFLRILLAASLYAFLAAALLILWRDLKRQTEMARLQKAPQITLQGSNGVGLYKFTKHEVMIGRDPTHDISLNDKTVSTQHARLTYHHNHCCLSQPSERSEHNSISHLELKQPYGAPQNTSSYLINFWLCDHRLQQKIYPV